MLNKKSRINLVQTTLMVATLAPLSVYADTAQKNISDAIGPGDSDSTWVLGAYAGTVTAPYVDEESEDFIAPNIEYRGEYFFISKDGIGFNLLRYDNLSVGMLLTGQDSLLSDDDDYDDNKTLLGLKERDSTLDAGIYIQHTTPMGQLKLVMLDEVTGEHNGQSARVDYTFDMKYKGININPLVGVAWTSADMVDHFFGVSTEEANADRAAYEGKNTTSFYTGVRARYEITENWDVEIGTAYINLGSGIKDSSITEKNDVFVSSLGFNYNF